MRNKVSIKRHDVTMSYTSASFADHMVKLVLSRNNNINLIQTNIDFGLNYIISKFFSTDPHYGN